MSKKMTSKKMTSKTGISKGIKLETSENNMLCLVPAKPMPREVKDKMKSALKVS